MNNHDHNHTPEADRIRAELEDRLMDQNLAEVLGGVTPNPDDRTVAPAPVAATEAEAKSSPQPARSGHSWIKPVALLATCAGIGLVLFGGLFSLEEDANKVAVSKSAERPSTYYVGEDIQYFPPESQQALANQERALKQYQREQQQAEADLQQQIAVREKSVNGTANQRGQGNDPHALTQPASDQQVAEQFSQALADVESKYAAEQKRRDMLHAQTLAGLEAKNVELQTLLEQAVAESSNKADLAKRLKALQTESRNLQQLLADARKRGESARATTVNGAESVPEKWQMKVISGKQETQFKVKQQEGIPFKAEAAQDRSGRAPVLDPQGRGYGGKLFLAEEIRRRKSGRADFDYNVQDGPQVPLGWRKATLEWKDGSWAADEGVDYSWMSPDGKEGVGPGNRGDNYAPIIENDFLSVIDSPLSTFSIDVDTASYSNMRRMLTQNNILPPPDAVRIEELVNYFNYDYPVPEGEDPFSVNLETASCPWRPENRLVRIALKGEEIPFEERPASNLVFLLDVSGSMRSDNKLPLLKSCFKMMVDYLTENDTISIVVYASGTRTVLPPTTGDQKSVIMEALDQLQAGGSTNGAGGIQLAYKTATENFIPGGLNRVILATDGDFNVGITSQGDLHRLIEEKAKSNVFLTTLGFGFGNLQDNTIELLADKGNGNYAYIDSLAEGRKVLIDEMGSTLNTIAKDVKIQIEFNPLQVAGYRLIGYENRLLAAQDFNDDTKDAGEIGAGHTVTAFYEIIPAGEGAEAQLVEREVDELEFQRPQKVTKLARKGDMLVVKLRYKEPTEDTSKLLKVFVKDSGNEFTAASRDFQFAASVASFGMLLRNSKYAGQASFKNVLEQAQATLGETPESYRVEFVELIKLADRLAGQVRN